MAGFTYLVILLIGLMVGISLGFGLLWLGWLVLRWTIWKNALLPDEPVAIPAPGDAEKKTSAGQLD